MAAAAPEAAGDRPPRRALLARRWARFVERPRIRMLRTRYARQITFVLARLSPHEFLGLHLTLGVLALGLAAWAFGAIAEDVATNAAIVQLDLAVATWLHLHGSAEATALLEIVSDIHSPVGIGVMAGALGVALAVRRRFYWLLALVVALPGGMLVNDLMKHVFHRARPHFDDPLLLLSTFSFPSGHVAGSTLFYGFVCALAFATLPRASSRTGVVAVALGAIAVVAMSRMYLGVHYLSDVLGAFCEALAWLAVALTGVHAFRQARTREGLLR